MQPLQAPQQQKPSLGNLATPFSNAVQSVGSGLQNVGSSLLGFLQSGGQKNQTSSPLAAGTLNLQANNQIQSQGAGRTATQPLGIANTQAAQSSQVVNPPTTVGEPVGTNPSDLNQNNQSNANIQLGGANQSGGISNELSGLFQNPQSQGLLQTQVDTLTRLGALQGQLAQSQVPSGAEVGLQTDINSLTNQINNLNPQQYLKDNPQLAAGGITQNQLLGQVSQNELPLTQALANLTLSKSVLGQQRQIAGYQLGAESTGLQNTANIANQIRQLTMFGGVPADIANTIIQRQLFPQYGVTQNIAGQPIAYNQYNPSQSFAIGQQGLGGNGGIGNGVGNFSGQSNPPGNTVGGYNLSTYATDPQYSQKVGTIYNQLPQFNSAQGVDQYIQSVAPNSPLTGSMIMASSTKYGIDPRILVAQAQEESGFGTQGAGAKTFNPGNVGNTGSATQNQGSWQAGLDAQAKELSLRQGGQGQQPNTVNIAGLPVQVSYTADGKGYINSDKVDDKILPYVKSAAPTMGLQVLTSDDVSKLRNIDVTTQNLQQLSGTINDILQPGLFGRTFGALSNTIQNITQSNPRIAAFKVYRDTAINTIQALAGGSGQGFRLNQGEIETATSNLPELGDNRETAQQKLSLLNGFLDKWKTEILGQNGQSSQSQTQGGNTNDPLGILQ